MRESIGGAWLLGIVALFIALFSSFLAYAISYTKAFKVKNEIINYIEKDKGFVFEDGNVTTMTESELTNATSTEAKSYRLLTSVGYNTTSVSCGNDGTSMPGGYCIKRVYSDTVAGVKVYYKVTTYIKVNFEIFNAQYKIPMSGETKTMYSENEAVNVERFE